MTTQPSLNHQLNILNDWWVLKSRESFYHYRQYIRANKFLDGWFQRELSLVLQKFYSDLIAGKRPIVIISAPPQHGKSWAIIDFVQWVAAKILGIRIIFASYSERLGKRCNLSFQRVADSPKYQNIFPDLHLNNNNSVTRSNQYQRNSELLEFVGTEGFFRNTTVRGPITGESLDLGIIDDPIKGRDEARSKTIRDKTWDWLIDDFYNRFSEHAGLLIINTRWHVDDPAGRLIKEKPGVQVYNFPALAVEDEAYRAIGDPLFPELKSKEFLLAKKAIAAPSSWESLHQGAPVIVGGNLFKELWWKYYKTLPKMKFRVIYMDTASKTKEQHDYSVAQLWGMCYEGRIYLIDMIRGKWESPQLLVNARAFWNKHRSTGDGVLRCIKVEDKSSGIGLIQTLRQEGIPIKGIPRNIDKVSRANDVTPEIEVGNVWLPENAEWLTDYLIEFNGFPNATHDDQVDPTMDAIEDMLINPVVTNYGDLV